MTLLSEVLLRRIKLLRMNLKLKQQGKPMMPGAPKSGREALRLPADVLKEIRRKDSEEKMRQEKLREEKLMSKEKMIEEKHLN